MFIGLMDLSTEEDFFEGNVGWKADLDSLLRLWDLLEFFDWLFCWDDMNLSHLRVPSGLDRLSRIVEYISFAFESLNFGD